MSIFTDAPTVEFCEKAGSGIIARPFYAISNLAYLVIPLLILRKSKDVLAITFALTAELVGTLSFIYDSVPNRLTQLFDLSGMYAIVSTLLVINLTRYKKNKLVESIALVPIVTLVSIISTYYFKGISGNVIFGLLVLAYVFSEIYLKKENDLKLWLASFLTFLAGFTIWLFDFKAWYCMPGNYLNGRGAFHLLTAVSVFILYRYYALNRVEFGIK